MKNAIFILIFLCLNCKKTTKEFKTTPKSFENVESFLKEFEFTVLEHNQIEILNLIDKEFIQDQLNDVMESNLEWFVNELFCGNIKNDNENRKCIKFNEVQYIKLNKIEPSTEDYKDYDVFFEVANTKFDTIITQYNFIKVREKNNKKYYGYFGISG